MVRPRPFYLVSTAGHPNYGDELITRAWLDHLARAHPRRTVWVDCPHPGRAAHLFGRTHPRVRFTDTLWELALGSPDHDPVEDAARVSGLIRDLGSPRFDPGLLALREAASVHLLGGGYLNSIWQDNLGLLVAAAEVNRSFGVRLFATGLGLLPIEDAHAELVRGALEAFEMVEPRDSATAAFCGEEIGLDDAFLAIALRRRLYATAQTPGRMVLVQGDLRAWSEEAATRSIGAFADGAADDEIGFAEAVPPDDVHYARLLRPTARFYPFGHIWTDGLPARRDQDWLTTRFHVHLMAAAAGASGVVIAGRPGYYDIKHQSLLDLGTGWNVIDAGADPREDPHRPSVDPTFPERARELAARKRALAERLY